MEEPMRMAEAAQEQGELPGELMLPGGALELEEGREPQAHQGRSGGVPSSSSHYIGVSWKKSRSAWHVQLYALTRCRRHIGCYASEEGAARAYDCATVLAHGPGSKRNFPCEVISEVPVSKGEERRVRSSSRFIGVSCNKSSWVVQLRDSQTRRKRNIGSFACEEDAANAHDCVVVQAHGPGAKRNFPGEIISELPVTLGEKRKKRSSSHFIGVCWSKSQSAWHVQLTDPQTKRQRRIGSYASEEDAEGRTTVRLCGCAGARARC
ncbi:hypothetical protein FOA52_013665 [Chlamydomonas sp. UWO 241]|nr:hypothetical protein FOA52_013665 [Chlamydomonas sp. UWO 241]